MTGRYRLFGSIGSPYALKMRALLRYRRIPFDWVPASLDWVPQDLDRPPASEEARAEIAHIRPPVIPVLWFPDDDTYSNDSTRLAYQLETRHAERPAVPTDPGLAFLSHLLEDMADEWGVKIAFHYRWGDERNAAFKSRIVTAELLGGGLDEATQLRSARHFAQRQQSRMPLVGCTPENAGLIEAVFLRILDIMQALSQSSLFLLGGRPTLADFGWFGELASLATDPGPAALMAARAPATFQWLQALDDASGIDGDWIDPTAPLPPPLLDFLHLAGSVYLPFLAANAAAIDAGEDSFEYQALGHLFSQGIFKYQAKCYSWLREELAALEGSVRSRTEVVLNETGCLEFLQ